MATKKSTTKKTAANAEKKSVQEPPEVLTPKPIVLKGFVKKQYQKLLDLRDNLLDAMNGVTRDTLKNTDGLESGGGGEHSGDAGSDSYDRDFALNLLAKEQDSLNEIEQAISRCERGVYGICEMSGEKIPKERLEAIPFARYTVTCQQTWEKDHSNAHRYGGDSNFTFSSGAMG